MVGLPGAARRAHWRARHRHRVAEDDNGPFARAGRARGRPPVRARTRAPRCKSPTMRSRAFPGDRHKESLVLSAWRSASSWLITGASRSLSSRTIAATARRAVPGSSSADPAGAGGRRSRGTGGWRPWVESGSQRPQAQGHTEPRPAILAATERHVRPYRATLGDVRKVPPKQ